MELHPMKADLDDGRLSSRQRDRKFTTFLDLKFDYHTEFINRLREHVQGEKYEWEQLQSSEAKRRSCAEKFVIKYGMSYWGTEENRRKYLMPAAFEDPASLCTYPELNDEIIRTITLLLERKANSSVKIQEKKNSMEPFTTPVQYGQRGSVSVPPYLSDISYRKSTLKPSTSQRAGDQISEGRNTRKRRATDMDKISLDSGKDLLEAKRLRASAPFGIRPFGSILGHGKDENGSIPDRPTNLTADPKIAGNNMPPSAVEDQVSHSGRTYPNDTKFLVEASNQEGMAPVWVSFQNFPSASSFLAHMATECRLTEWSPDHQLMPENTDWQSLQIVVAASVKFEWSGFEIRVRQGMDKDWTTVFEELQKAWKAKELKLDGGLVQSFRIRVMLHIN
ncbi:hypothetical protein BDV28DRAFT_149600 [Aspergillus coremiiformis]|uniref:Uncharacterized protein n=1 Tax=Aspergillus coremiiformis TaxID=138285 RepID=A0A5N6Z2G4_9EURO|nr:hypothetical protein BDV28DRAFT_149600 [Aspergillus coremiiformis]